MGSWDGDTFVVDTAGFNDKTWLDKVGHPHTDALHTIERFRRIDFGHLQLELTIDDPKAYSKGMDGKDPVRICSRYRTDGRCLRGPLGL